MFDKNYKRKNKTNIKDNPLFQILYGGSQENKDKLENILKDYLNSNNLEQVECNMYNRGVLFFVNGWGLAYIYIAENILNFSIFESIQNTEFLIKNELMKSVEAHMVHIERQFYQKWWAKLIYNRSYRKHVLAIHEDFKRVFALPGYIVDNNTYDALSESLQKELHLLIGEFRSKTNININFSSEEQTNSIKRYCSTDVGALPIELVELEHIIYKKKCKVRLVSEEVRILYQNAIYK